MTASLRAQRLVKHGLGLPTSMTAGVPMACPHRSGRGSFDPTTTRSSL